MPYALIGNVLGQMGNVLGRSGNILGRMGNVLGQCCSLTGNMELFTFVAMGKTTQVAADRAFDQTKTVLPAEVARGVYMQNPPSLRALKLMHLMIGTAAGRMADDVRHDVRLSDIRRIDGMANHDRSSLVPLFQELRAAVLTYDDPTAMRVVVGGLLDEARIDYRHELSGDLLVSWYFGRTFREMADKSNHWAIIDRQTVFHLSSKYAVLMFQHLASLAGMGRLSSKTFTIPELRALLGVTSGKMERFSNLMQRAIAPAVAEINQISRLHLDVTTNKVGRTVASVTIKWRVNADRKEARAELERHSAGRKARRDGAVEQVEVMPQIAAKAAGKPAKPVAFPAEGGITFNDHWAAIARENAPGWDVDVVADRFRQWWLGKGRKLDARDVATAFSGFCKSLGKPR